MQTLTGIDPWFLDQVAEIIEVEVEIAGATLAATDAATLRNALPAVAAHLQRFYGAPP